MNSPPFGAGFDYRLTTILFLFYAFLFLFFFRKANKKPLKCLILNGFSGGSDLIRTDDTPGMNRWPYGLYPLILLRFTWNTFI